MLLSASSAKAYQECCFAEVLRSASGIEASKAWVLEEVAKQRGVAEMARGKWKVILRKCGLLY